MLERTVEIQVLGLVEKPSKRPTNTFLPQALDVVESFDGPGMVAVARGEVDSDVVSVLVDSSNLRVLHVPLNGHV